MQTLAQKARRARYMTKTERTDIRQVRSHVSTTFIRSEMAAQPTKSTRPARQTCEKLVIKPGETPQEAYLRSKEEWLKGQSA